MFNDKERKGVILLIIILLVFIMISWMKTWNFSSAKVEGLNQVEHKFIELSKLRINSQNNKYRNHEYELNSYSRSKYHEEQGKEIEVALFDPNSVTAEQLMKMGVSKKAANNWQKYLQKGGRFYRKEDIGKIFGITPNVYHLLLNYVVIDPAAKKSITRDSFEIAKHISKSNETVKKKILIELNTSTDLELLELNGIGEKLSARIIKYRDKLGGFVKTEQLLEVYGLPPETFQSIKDQVFVDSRMLKKIKINLADAYILYSFPYIARREAYQIVNYRKQHGNFRNIDDLRKIKSLNDDFILKIEPYLDFDDE
ncbi:MAG: helix-hairpin-helix domain-containing protein [Deltaproteobacteria bacterium]